MSTLFAKNGFSRPSLELFCGVFRHVLGLRVNARPTENLCSRWTRKTTVALQRTKKIGLYFRGVATFRSNQQGKSSIILKILAVRIITSYSLNTVHSNLANGIRETPGGDEA